MFYNIANTVRRMLYARILWLFILGSGFFKGETIGLLCGPMEGIIATCQSAPSIADLFTI